MPTINENTPASSAAKNIQAVIEAMTDAQKSQLDLKKAVMMKQIGDKMDLAQKGAETRQDMQIKGEAFNNMTNNGQPTPDATTTYANGLNDAGRATNATAGTVGAQPMLPGQPQAPQAMPMAPTPMPQAQNQPTPNPTPMINAGAQRPNSPVLNGIVPPAGISIPSPIGKPLPPPQGKIIMGQNGPMLNPNFGSNDNQAYSKIYQKWASGQQLTSGETKWVQDKFNNGPDGKPISKNVSKPIAQPIATPNINVPPTTSTPSLDQERAQYDNTPTTAQSIAKDSMMENPEWRNSVAQSIAFGGTPQQRMIPAPGAVDVEKEKNPFFLSKWGQHILNDNDSNGPVIQDMIKNHGLNAVLNELPATVTQPALTAAKYQQDPNNMSSTMGGGNQRRQMLTLIKAINPNWSEINYKQIQSNIPEFLNPNSASGKAVSAIRQVPLHLDTLDKAMTDINNSQFRNVPLFNKAGEMLRDNVRGNPQLAAVQTSLAAVHNELTTAWAGTNNSDSKKAEWDKALSSYSTPADWPALRATASRLLSEAADAREDGFKGISGGMSLKEYNGQPVLPQAQKQMLDKMQGGYKMGDNNNSTDKGVDKLYGGMTIAAARAHGFTGFNTDTNQWVK